MSLMNSGGNFVPLVVIALYGVPSMLPSVGGHEKLPGDGHEAARWRT